MMRLLSFCWVDGRKLGQIIQEICPRFLHFRRQCQHTVAVIIPLLITRWIDRYPQEFVQLHLSRRRLDGGADTLFDMTLTFANDSGRRRAAQVLNPFQTTLLFLMPDVFEVASDLRVARGGNISKKVAFLESLRKTILNRNEQSGSCLVSLLRAARHFDAEADAAILSYAMDVKNDIRDAVFRRTTSPSEASIFDQSMMTAAFISLAHINSEGLTESLVPTCLHPNSPQSFKIAVVQGCAYFARQSDGERYKKLLKSVVPFVQAQLKGAANTSSLAASTSTMMSAAGSYALRGPEADSPTYMLFNLIDFVDALPNLVFGLEPGGDVAPELSEVVFSSLIKCVISPDVLVQRLASRVTANILGNEKTLEDLRRSGTLAHGAALLRFEFWMRT